MSKIKSFVLLVLLFLIVACSGGGGSSSGGSTYTVGGAVSGLSGTLVLRNNGADDLTITRDGAFTFATAVSNGTAYSVIIQSRPSNQNCSVTNGSGSSDADVTAVAVACANKTWVNPSSLSDHISVAGQDALSPRVSLGKNGDAVITWCQFDSSGKYQIYKSEYRNGVWISPSSLDDHISFAGQDAISQEVAMDDNGNTIIMWQQSDGTNNQVYKSSYRNGIWTHPTSTSDHIGIAGQSADYPQMAMDSNGNAIITWHQFDGAYDRIYMSEYRNGVWNDASSLADQITAAGQYASNPHVALADNGNSIITWTQWDGTNDRIYKSEYRNGIWSHPTSTSDHINVTGPSVEFPLVVMSNNGDAIIIWIQYDSSGTNYQVYKSECRNGIWTNPVSLDDHISVAGQSVQYPRVAMDNNGSAIITWAQSDGVTNQTYKSEYRNGAWINPSSLDDHISVESAYDDAYAPDAAMDDNGNAIITWKQYDGDYDSIYKSEYRNGAWTNPASLADRINVAGSDADDPDVSMDDNGNAIISWWQRVDTFRQIFKSEYR